jgi:hypothetical protein
LPIALPFEIVKRFYFQRIVSYDRTHRNLKYVAAIDELFPRIRTVAAAGVQYLTRNVGGG